MFKKTAFMNRYSFQTSALIVLMSITSLQAADVPKVSFMDTLRSSRSISMWLGAIVPPIIVGIAAHCVFRANYDNPDRRDIVAISKCMRFMSFFAGLFFLDHWIEFDFKPFALTGFKS